MQKIPECVGIILDGNRRWAVQKGLSKLEGHKHGADTLERAVLAARDLGIKHLVVFAFSTENWSRSAEEVARLLEIFGSGIEKFLPRLATEKIRVRFVGDRGRFSSTLQKAMRNVEEQNPADAVCTFWICVSYGGRAEIVEATKATVAAGEEITEESIGKHLWTAEMPEPDIIIRTSGEKRLSGFLTWKGIYSELFFLDTMWPDFTKEDLEGVLAEYQTRQRRMGK